MHPWQVQHLSATLQAIVGSSQVSYSPMCTRPSLGCLVPHQRRAALAGEHAPPALFGLGHAGVVIGGDGGISDVDRAVAANAAHHLQRTRKRQADTPAVRSNRAATMGRRTACWCVARMPGCSICSSLLDTSGRSPHNVEPSLGRQDRLHARRVGGAAAADLLDLHKAGPQVVGRVCGNTADVWPGCTC